MAQAFFGGVHPNDMKAATNEKAIEQLSPPPAQVVIPMSMHFGAPCTPIVSVGDYVKVGQKIGEFKGLGAPIHASVSGKVVAIEPRPYSMGGNMTSVVIENDYQNTVSEEVKAPADPNALTTEEMIEIVKNAGIVGMGGATFPTQVKLTPPPGNKAEVLIIGAGIEADIAELETYEEKQLFLEDLGLKEAGVNKLIRTAYHLLNLQTYFTAGPKEVRAWTFRKGMKAPQTAGIIHTDFEKGFIRAEVIKYDDFIAYGSETKCKEAGKMSVEGKDYVVQDGDMMNFRFNV